VRERAERTKPSAVALLQRALCSNSNTDTLIAGRGTDSLFGGDVLVFSGDDMLFSSIA
jgi:hypothetical protein